MMTSPRRQPANFTDPEPVVQPVADPLSAPIDVAVAPAAPAVQTSAPRARRTPVRRREGEVAAATVYGAAFLVSALWVCAPVAFALGYRGGVAPFTEDRFALLVFGLLAVGPAALVWVAAYMIRQAQRLAAEARHVQAMADAMISPAMLAAAEAGDLVRGVREEIARAGEAAREAHDHLTGLRQALADESQRLGEAAAAAGRSAVALGESLGRERAEMTGLSQSLDTQAAAVAEVITRQARMVAEASDLAEAQLREAEASLTARAADLTSAAGEAGHAARAAGDDLTRHIARLEDARVGLGEQAGLVEQSLGQQRAAVLAVADALRGDHQAFAAEAEAHAGQLAEFINQARLSTLEMADRAARGGETLRQLLSEASEQTRGLAEAARGQADALGEAARQSLADVVQAAAEERARLGAEARAGVDALARSAEEARTAAARHAEAAQEQVDRLSEAAFSAGKTANQVFEARLEEARALIQGSSQLVEQAGSAAADRLAAGAEAARATLDQLSALLSEVDARAADLPVRARAQVEDVRAAVVGSIEELTAQARRTAEETQAIDAAFQGRVRRNYEMLSQAVQLMGSVAGATPPPEVAAPPAPEIQPEPPPAREPRRRAPEPEPEAEMAAAAPAGKPQLRSRLKLTPTETDAEVSSVFEPVAPRAEEPAPGGDGWTWKELLTSLDGAAAAVADDLPPEARLLREVTAMGVDLGAVLPRARLEEAVEPFRAGDAKGVREVVRRVAPAATRRLARRLFTDEPLKVIASGYMAERRPAVVQSGRSTRDDAAGLDLLASDAGRLFLLLDAAGGDMI